MSNEDQDDISNADFWKKAGDDFFKQEQYEKAIECYKEAINLDPGYKAAWNNLGFTYSKLGKLDEVKKCKDKLNELRNTEMVIQQKKSQPSQQIQPQAALDVPKPKLSVLPTSYQANNLLIALFIIGIVCIFIPVIGFLFVIAIVIASAYFVYKDAENIGAGRSPNSWSPVTFGLLVLLFWLIALPAYILMRKSIYEEGQAFSRGETPTKSKISGFLIVLIILGIVVIFIILAAVLAAFVFGMSGSVATTKNVGVSVAMNDFGLGVITMQGGNDLTKITGMRYSIDGGVAYPVKATSAGSSAPIGTDFGVVGKRFYTGEQIEGKHLVLIASFDDGTDQVIFDKQFSGSTPAAPVSTPATVQPVSTPARTLQQNTITMGEINAAKKALEYLRFMPFSREGLIKQLEFEGFTRQEAEYGVRAVGY